MAMLRVIGRCTNLPAPICRIADDYAEWQTGITEWRKERLCYAIGLYGYCSTTRQMLYYIGTASYDREPDSVTYISIDTPYTRTLDLWSANAPSWPYMCNYCGRYVTDRLCCQRGPTTPIDET